MDTKRKPVPRSTSTEAQSHEETIAGPSTPSRHAPVAEAIDVSENDVPPSYTGPSIPASPGSSPASASVISRQASLPVDFNAYRIAGLSLSKDKMTYTTSLAHYSQSPQALSDLIQKHAQLPPHPQIRIVAGQEGNGKPLFDIKISMMKYFVRQTDARGSAGWQYIRTLNDGELGWRGGKQTSVQPTVKGGLDEWISKYVLEEIKDKR